VLTSYTDHKKQATRTNAKTDDSSAFLSAQCRRVLSARSSISNLPKFKILKKALADTKSYFLLYRCTCLGCRFKILSS